MDGNLRPKFKITLLYLIYGSPRKIQKNLFKLSVPDSKF